MFKKYLHLVVVLICFCHCTSKHNDRNPSIDTLAGREPISDSLLQIDKVRSNKNYSKVIHWPEDRTPIAPSGFTVSVYADSLENPSWLYITPNGDVLIAEANSESSGVEKIIDKISGKSASKNTDKSANRITILRDQNRDGTPDLQQVFLSGLNQPFGMLNIGNALFVANTDALMEFSYQPGQTQINSTGKKLLELPADDHHWMKNIVANPDDTKIYITLGPGNAKAKQSDERKAGILEINIDGTHEKVFASGLYNLVGMDWEKNTKDLWAIINERDESNDNLLSDYLLKVKDGMQQKNSDLKKSDLVYLGKNTSSLGFAFYNQKSFPAKYQGGAFIAQQGSVNHSEPFGYKVVFVPFVDGKPSGEPEDFLTGFIADKEKNEVYGRPISLAVLPDGSLLVADDVSNIIWRVQSIK